MKPSPNRSLALQGGDKEVSCRLARSGDLIVAGGKYHLKYCALFLRNTQKIPQDDQKEDKAEVKRFEQVINLLQQRPSEGYIYSLKAVRTSYSNRLGQKYQLQFTEVTDLKTGFRNFLGILQHLFTTEPL